MTLLAPLPAIIAASIAIPILLSLYLLKLRRRTVRISTTRFWEQAVSDMQANVPLRWIKPSWLLLLQLLGLLGLIIAIGRPAIPAESAARPRTIIVIDHSASMSAADAPGDPNGPPVSRLEAAKREARRLIDQLAQSSSGERPEAMVIAMAAESRIIERFTSDPRSLGDALDAIAPTDQPADLDSAARLIQAATVEPVETTRPTQTAVLLYSDGSIDPSDVGLPGSVSIQFKPIGPSLNPSSADGPAQPDNLGIVALGAKRDADNPNLVRVFARIANAGSKPVDIVLTCAVNAEQAQLVPLSIPAATVDPVKKTSTPGEAGASFSLDQPEGGLITLSIPRDDLLPTDNLAGFTLRPVSKPRILVVGPNDPTDPILPARGEMGVDRFLLGVLSDLEPATLRVIDKPQYDANYASLAADSVSAKPEFDLVVFDRVSPIRQPAIPTINIGAAPAIPGLTLSALPREQWPQSATRIISWRRTHPLLRHVALDTILVSPPMRLTIEAPASSPESPPAPTITPLAFGRAGPLIALVEEPAPQAIRRLVLAFDLARTNWGPEVSFPVFFSSAVDYLTGRGDSAAGSFFTTSTPITLPALPNTPTITVSGPESFSLTPQSSTVSLGIPRLTGLYSAQGVLPESSALPVNLLSPRESALGVASEFSIGGRPSVLAGSREAEPTKPLKEIWRWFVLAAAVLLTIEWFLFAFKTRIS